MVLRTKPGTQVSDGSRIITLEIKACVVFKWDPSSHDGRANIPPLVVLRLDERLWRAL